MKMTTQNNLTFKWKITKYPIRGGDTIVMQLEGIDQVNDGDRLATFVSKEEASNLWRSLFSCVHGDDNLVKVLKFLDREKIEKLIRI